MGKIPARDNDSHNFPLNEVLACILTLNEFFGLLRNTTNIVAKLEETHMTVFDLATRFMLEMHSRYNPHKLDNKVKQPPEAPQPSSSEPVPSPEQTVVQDPTVSPAPEQTVSPAPEQTVVQDSTVSPTPGQNVVPDAAPTKYSAEDLIASTSQSNLEPAPQAELPVEGQSTSSIKGKEPASGVVTPIPCSPEKQPFSFPTVAISSDTPVWFQALLDTIEV